MPSEQDIADQQELLQAHRQTLAVYLRQVASTGAAHAPPSIINGIREAREAIRRIKQTLREWGVAVTDLPNDEEPPPSLQEPPPSDTPPLGRSSVQTGEQSINIGVGDLQHAHIHDVHIQTVTPKEKVPVQRVSQRRVTIGGVAPTTRMLIAIGGVGTSICVIAFCVALRNISISSMSGFGAANFWIYFSILFLLLFVGGFILSTLRFALLPWLNVSIETDNRGQLYTTKVQGTCPRCGSIVRLRRVGSDDQKATKLVCRRNPFQHVWEFDPTELPDIAGDVSSGQL